jgi:glutamine amidotransferase
MIQIIDYGAGNTQSVLNALKQLDIEAEVISSARELADGCKLIFPGVGAASSTMEVLKKSFFADVIPYLKSPFLGICLGMQLLSDFSEEGGVKCLGILEGKVKKFSGNVKVPQIGWNKVKIVNSCDPLFCGIEDDSYFYFVNSYYFDTDPEYVIGKTNYGCEFASAVRKNNFYGVQFHPEKSGEVGLKLLNNFCKLC